MAWRITRFLIADDDLDDQDQIREAFQSHDAECRLEFVADGEQLTDRLQCDPQFYPHVIILDLNMPKKDGREALRELKSNPKLRQIPIVVLTTSNAEDDVLKCYELGVNSYIIKPATFKKLEEIVRDLSNYWCKLVMIPNAARFASEIHL